MSSPTSRLLRNGLGPGGCLWLALAGPVASAQTTLRLDALPPTTPAGALLYVAGSFNNWQPADSASQLVRQPNGTYQLALPASVQGPQEFKFTRGSWATVEATARYEPLANRRATLLGAPTVVACQVAAWQDQRPGGTPPPGPKAHTLASNVRVLADSFRLPQLGGRARRVWLYLPPGYVANPHRRYPVLYLQDGQNVFDEATAFAGEWGVDETLNKLAAADKNPPSCIVVAIDNGGARRLSEYSPWANAEYKQGGEGDQYTDFLARTLKPYIDAHYRTQPEAAHTAVAGSSMGGLIAFYAGLKYPRVFGRVGVFSPAFWFAQDSLLAYEQRRAPAARASRFYFVAGPAESETMLPLMRKVRDGLLARGLAPSHLAFKAPADGQHAEWFWRREFGPAYQWLLAE